MSDFNVYVNSRRNCARPATTRLRPAVRNPRWPYLEARQPRANRGQFALEKSD